LISISLAYIPARGISEVPIKQSKGEVGKWPSIW